MPQRIWYPFVKKADDLIINIQKNLSNVLYIDDNENITSATLTLKDEGIELDWNGVNTSGNRGLQEIKYSNISRIELKKGLISGTIEITFQGGKVKIENVDNDLGYSFVSDVENRLIDKNINQNKAVDK